MPHLFSLTFPIFFHLISWSQYHSIMAITLKKHLACALPFLLLIPSEDFIPYQLWSEGSRLFLPSKVDASPLLTIYINSDPNIITDTTGKQCWNSPHQYSCQAKVLYLATMAALLAALSGDRCNSARVVAKTPRDNSKNTIITSAICSNRSFYIKSGANILPAKTRLS